MDRIIIFVIFAIISSLFNKDKKVKKTSKQSIDLGENQANPDRTQDTQHPQHQRKVSKGRLGDLIKEFKTDFDDVFKEKKYNREKNESYPIEYEYRGYEDVNQQHEYSDKSYQEPAIKSEKMQASKKHMNNKTVYDDEIEDHILDSPLVFDEETLLQGIIMSEILGKPKALKR